MVQEATQQMVENQQRAQDKAENIENEREADYSGSVRVEGLSLSEALESL